MKHKKWFSVLLALLMTLTMLPNMAQAEMVVEIDTYEELKAFAALVNEGETSLSAVLTANIETEERDWTPIGYDADHAYRGTFDGRNHTIAYLSNADVIKPDCAGLFGYVGAAGTVKNVCMDDPDLTAVSADSSLIVYAGTVAGYSEGKLENVRIVKYASVRTLGSSGSNANYCFYAGGIAGYNAGTIDSACVSGRCSIESVSNNSNVNNISFVGGLAGFNSGEIINSVNDGSGSVNASARNDAYVGGLVGYNDGEGVLNNCKNHGSAEVVAGLKVADIKASAGGIAGYNNGSIRNTDFAEPAGSRQHIPLFAETVLTMRALLQDGTVRTEAFSIASAKTRLPSKRTAAAEKRCLPAALRDIIRAGSNHAMSAAAA